MKKFFSLFTALLFAGSLFATEYELTTTITDGEYVIGAINGTAGTDNKIQAINTTIDGGWGKYVTLTPSSGKITNPSSEVVWTLTKLSANSFSLQNGTNYYKISTSTGSGSVALSTTSSAIYFAAVGSSTNAFELSGVSEFTVSSGNQLACNQQSGNGYRQYAQREHGTTASAISTQIRFYKKVEGSETSPTITAANIDFGTVYVDAGSKFTKDVQLSVTGANLTEAIQATPSSSALELSGTLTAEGGTLNVHIAAPAGAFSATITLTSGETSKVVNVIGKVQQKYSTLSVAEVLEAYGESTLLVDDSLLIRGIVKSVASQYTYGATVVLTDASDATKELSLFNIKSLNNANFSSIEDNLATDVNGVKFTIGDTLIAKGKLGLAPSTSALQLASGGLLTAILRDKDNIKPEIAATPKTINIESPAKVDNNAVSIAYFNWEEEVANIAGSVFADADCTQPVVGSWISNIAFNDAKTQLTFDVTANTGKKRTAYIQITATGASAEAKAVVTVTQSHYYAPIDNVSFGLFKNAIEEGDYLVVYNGKAMKAEVASDRLKYAEVTPADNVITISDASIVWHIAASATEGFWTLYSAFADAYAAGTGTASKAQLLASGTDDKALWTVTKDDNGTFEFVNKANDAANVNKNLRNNGTYGFACYSTGTGGALSLYKREYTPTSLDNTASDTKAVKTIVNGQLIIEKAGVKYNVLGQTIR